MSGSPVVIATYANEFEALVAQAVLREHDVPSMLLRDDAGGMQLALTWLRGVRLAVRHADAVRALHVLERAVEPGDEEREAS